MKRAIIIILALAAVAATWFYMRRQQATAAQMQGMAMSESVSTVRTQVAEVATLHDYINTNGDIGAVNSVDVFPDIGGRIVNTSVVLGSRVQRGDVVAQVDPSEPGSNYALSAVYAPISGSVITTPLKTGTKVTTSSSLMTIGDVSSLQITARIPERYVAALRIGLKAEITLEAYPDVIFSATVTHVSPVLDTNTRTKEILLRFDENDGRINAGMFGKVKLYTVDYGGEIVMPTDAIVMQGDTPWLFVLRDDGTVERREVTQGMAVDGVVQILSGIRAGERVVVEGEQTLSDGAKVNDISQN